MSRWRILVVDDEEGVLRSVRRILQDAYEVVTCSDPIDALHIAQQMPPDLAIVDIMMPRLDGFELMERLQAQSGDTDVILMTGSVHETDGKLIKAIRGRAFYFLNKPFDREVLLALVDRCLEMRRLGRADRVHTERLRQQLDSATAFQQAMLPPNRAEIAGFQISALYHPCDEVAGDFYEYAASGDDAVTVMVADVVGHGASAAMLTAVVKSAFHKARSEHYHPSAVACHICEDMAAFAADQFLTMICVRLSRSERQIEYVNAGHCHGLLCHKDGELIELIAGGPIVSPCLPDTSRPVGTITCGQEATLLLYTDGVVEAFNEQGAEFGFERLHRAVRSHDHDGAGLIEGIYRDVKAHMGGRAPLDDLTMLAVSCR